MDTGVILAALVTGIFAFVAGKNNSKGAYVTKQREDWRSYLREWVVELTQLVDEYNSFTKYYVNEKQRLFRVISSKINAIIVRLNPVRDDKFINYLLNNCNENEGKKEGDEDIDQDINHIEHLNMEVITYYISKLLKEDWERVKHNTSVFGETLFLNIIFIIFSTSVGYLALTEIGEPFNFDVLAIFLYGFLPFVALKLAYHLLMSNQKVRIYNYKDIFDNTPTPFCGIKNMMSYRKVELIVTVTYLLSLSFAFCKYVKIFDLPINPINTVISIGVSLTIFLILISFMKVDEIKTGNLECIDLKNNYGKEGFYSKLRLKSKKTKK